MAENIYFYLMVSILTLGFFIALMLKNRLIVQIDKKVSVQVFIIGLISVLAVFAIIKLFLFLYDVLIGIN